jgi:hypothetical protein
MATKGSKNMKNFVLPCDIGDIIYVVEDYNQYYDEKYMSIKTIYGNRIIIKEIIVEGFIVDKEGIFIAEDSFDGWNKLTVYHNLTLEKYGDCKIFFSIVEAKNFVNTIK